MIRAGWLRDVRGVEIGFQGINLDDVPTGSTAHGRDFDAGALGRVLEDSNAAAVARGANWKTRVAMRCKSDFFPVARPADRSSV
jgi:hypothetical protein